MKVFSTTLLRLSTCTAFLTAKPTSTSTFTRSFSRTAMQAGKPFGIIVEVVLDKSRTDEFLSIMENNAISSRKEPGCLRFDVLRDQSNPDKYFFYEVYESAAAVDFHKTQPHYAAWADFKESGGAISSVSHKADGEFMS